VVFLNLSLSVYAFNGVIRAIENKAAEKKFFQPRLGTN
jgi:hypothetical protein